MDDGGIHPYWIRKYGLDRKDGVVMTLPARAVMHPLRFDLFAKVFYVRFHKEKPLLAKRVYLENIRCLVPTGKEYGKEEEKDSFSKHLHVFDELILKSETGRFEPSESLIPVGQGNLPLDGAHRVSAQAFYDKEVAICRYDAVKGDRFSYKFFLTNGMSLYTADLSAYEGIRMLEGMKVLCLWEDTGAHVQVDGTVFYKRAFNPGKAAYLKLRTSIEPQWKCGTAPRKHPVRFIFYIPRNSSESTGCDAREIGRTVLTWEGRKSWYKGGGLACTLCGFFERYLNAIGSDFKFCILTLKLRLSNIRCKAWIRFYNLVSPVWKRK